MPFRKVLGRDTPEGRRRVARQRLSAVLLVLGLGLVGGCGSPSTGGGLAGFPQTERNLTRIAPQERQVLPEISGPALGTKQLLTSRGYPGKVVVINVWGSWCAPCRSEAPQLEAASRQTADTAQFLGITSKDYDPAQAIAFTRAFSINYPSIFDPTGKVLLNFAEVLPPSAIPSTMIVDSEGRLAARVLGPITETTLVDMIDDVAGGS
jgi:thiol-disulfide isomerase/thioredoxin